MDLGLARVEQRPVGQRRPGRDVGRQGLPDDGGQGDRPALLGRLGLGPNTTDGCELPADVNLAVQGVDVGASEREQLADPEAEPGLGDHHRPVARGHRLCDLDDARAATLNPGPELVAFVQARIDVFAGTYTAHYPAAVKCLFTDRDQLASYLPFPVEYHRRIRHSNIIERTFGEVRRRVKVIGRLPGEVSCLSLVWAVLDRASRGWRGFTITSEATRHPQDLRRALLDPPTQLRPGPTTRVGDDELTETVGVVA